MTEEEIKALREALVELRKAFERLAETYLVLEERKKLIKSVEDSLSREDN